MMLIPTSSFASMCSFQRTAQLASRSSPATRSTIVVRSQGHRWFHLPLDYSTRISRRSITTLTTTKTSTHHATAARSRCHGSNNFPSGNNFFAAAISAVILGGVTSLANTSSCATDEADVVRMLAAAAATAGGGGGENANSNNSDEMIPHKITATLFVWDFDWTIVNCNSDEYIPAQFITDEEELRRGFQEEWESPQNNKDWHACVEAMIRRAMMIMDHHGDDQAAVGATPETLLLQAARQMPYLTSVKEALETIHNNQQHQHGQMILSDGNTLFIGAFLEEHGMVEYFTHGIVSNEGVWCYDADVDVDDNNDHDEVDGNTPDDDGCDAGSEKSIPPPRLCVIHQSKSLGGHNCPRCPANLCKTQALEHTLNKWFVLGNINEEEEEEEGARTRRRRPRIVYVGDGANDACPVLNVLEEGDVMLARSGRRRMFANRRKGGETDEEASTNRDGMSSGARGGGEEEEGSSFGILPALRRAREEEDEPMIPKCQVIEWRTGDELKHLVQRLLLE